MQALQITNLTKTYKNDVHALKGINLTVQEGDFFALLGPNGAGKSTTIGIVTSLVNKSGGTIKIFGHDLDQEPVLAKMNIGLVPQEFNFNIFEKVIDIVTYQAGCYGVPWRTANQRAEYFLKKLDLWDKRNQPAQFLSGGMKRRLMIARALISQPKLLILDEPTAGVDIEIRRSMWSFLREINQQGTTIILTTHYLEEAENLCKNIAIINKGEIIADTSVKALLTQLNSETFILYLQQPIDHTLVIPNFNYQIIDDTTIEVEVNKQQNLSQLFNLLAAHNIHISSMRNKANRLEELFLRLIANNPEEI